MAPCLSDSGGSALTHKTSKMPCVTASLPYSMARRQPRSKAREFEERLQVELHLLLRICNSEAPDGKGQSLPMRWSCKIAAARPPQLPRAAPAAPRPPVPASHRPLLLPIRSPK